MSSTNFALVRSATSCGCVTESVTLVKFLHQFGPRRGSAHTCELHGPVVVASIDVVEVLDNRAARLRLALTLEEWADARSAYERSQLVNPQMAETVSVQLSTG